MRLLYRCWLPRRLLCAKKLVGRRQKTIPERNLQIAKPEKNWHSSKTQDTRRLLQLQYRTKSNTTLAVLSTYSVHYLKKKKNENEVVIIFFLLPAFWIQTSAPLKTKRIPTQPCRHKVITELQCHLIKYNIFRGKQNKNQRVKSYKSKIQLCYSLA